MPWRHARPPSRASGSQVHPWAWMCARDGATHVQWGGWGRAPVPFSAAGSHRRVSEPRLSCASACPRESWATMSCASQAGPARLVGMHEPWLIHSALTRIKRTLLNARGQPLIPGRLEAVFLPLVASLATPPTALGAFFFFQVCEPWASHPPAAYGAPAWLWEGLAAKAPSLGLRPGTLWWVPLRVCAQSRRGRGDTRPQWPPRQSGASWGSGREAPGVEPGSPSLAHPTDPPLEGVG